jgi:hypothetical protein
LSDHTPGVTPGQRLAPRDVLTSGQLFDPAPRRPTHVRILRAEVATYCRAHGLDFDERDLLEHLLDVADWRTGAVPGFTLTGLAADLRYGPSRRRTLGEQLDRLAAAGAIDADWSAGGAGGRPGRMVVLVYAQLVALKGDARTGWVGVRPDALADYASGHGLSGDARALLRLLLVLVDPWRRSLDGRGTLGLGRRRRQRLLGELVDAGAVRCGPDCLQVLVYEQLVEGARRIVGNGPAEPDRAEPMTRSRGADDQIARTSDQIARRFDQIARTTSGFAPLELPEVSDLTPEPEALSRPTVVEVHGVGEDFRAGVFDQPPKGQEPPPGPGDELLAAIARAAPASARRELLADVDQVPGRIALRSLLTRLEAQVGFDAAVSCVAGEWPVGRHSAMAHAISRAKRRVEGAPIVTGPAGHQVDCVDELNPLERRRRRLAGAASLGRNWAAAGVDEAEVCAHFDDPEERAAALAAARAVAVPA